MKPYMVEKKTNLTTWNFEKDFEDEEEAILYCKDVSLHMLTGIDDDFTNRRVWHNGDIVFEFGWNHVK